MEIEVGSLAMLCPRTRFLIRCLRNYFSGRDTGLGLAVGLYSCDNVWPLSERGTYLLRNRGCERACMAAL